MDPIVSLIKNGSQYRVTSNENKMNYEVVINNKHIFAQATRIDNEFDTASLDYDNYEAYCKYNDKIYKIYIERPSNNDVITVFDNLKKPYRYKIVIPELSAATATANTSTIFNDFSDIVVLGAEIDSDVSDLASVSVSAPASALPTITSLSVPAVPSASEPVPVSALPTIASASEPASASAPESAVPVIPFTFKFSENNKINRLIAPLLKRKLPTVPVKPVVPPVSDDYYIIHDIDNNPIVNFKDVLTDVFVEDINSNITRALLIEFEDRLDMSFMKEFKDAFKKYVFPLFTDIDKTITIEQTPESIATAYKDNKQFGRCYMGKNLTDKLSQLYITGDGGCLFYCFSIILKNSPKYYNVIKVYLLFMYFLIIKNINIITLGTNINGRYNILLLHTNISNLFNKEIADYIANSIADNILETFETLLTHDIKDGLTQNLIRYTDRLYGLTKKYKYTQQQKLQLSQNERLPLEHRDSNIAYGSFVELDCFTYLFSREIILFTNKRKDLITNNKHIYFYPLNYPDPDKINIIPRPDILHHCKLTKPDDSKEEKEGDHFELLFKHDPPKKPIEITPYGYATKVDNDLYMLGSYIPPVKNRALLPPVKKHAFLPSQLPLKSLPILGNTPQKGGKRLKLRTRSTKPKPKYLLRVSRKKK